MKKKSSNNKESLIFTRETLGMTILLFCAIVLLALFTGRTVFAGFGGAICTFMYGTFGYGCYFVVALLAYLGEWLAFEKVIKVKLRPAIWIAVTVLCLFLLFHTVTTRGYEFNSSYIAACYTAAEEGWAGYTFGGVISALIVYPVVKVTKLVGAYIIFSLLTVFFGYVSVMSVRKHYFKNVNKNTGLINTEVNREVEREVEREVAPQAAPVYDNVQPVNEPVYENQEQPYNNPDYQQQPYGNMYQGEQQFAPQPNNDYVSPAQQVFGINTQPAEEQPEEIDYSTLGKKLLLDDEFAAENYRRNGIFDENSYFNHPIHSNEDYLKGFSSGKKSSGTNIQKTYSDAYQQSVEQQKTSMPGNVYYGDEPCDKLEDYTPASTGAYPSQQESSGYNGDVQENPYEVFPYETTEDNTEAQDNVEEAQTPSFTDRFTVENTDENADNGVTDFTPREDIISARTDREDIISARTDEDIFSVPDRRGESEPLQPEAPTTDRMAGLGDRSRDQSLNLSRSEEPSQESTERSDRNDLYSLFGSGNSRLGENKPESDGRLSSRGLDRESAEPIEGRSENIRERTSPLFGEGQQTPRERSGSVLFGDEQTDGRRRSNANLFDDEPAEESENTPADTRQNIPFDRPSVSEDISRARPAPAPVPMRTAEVKEVKEEKKEQPAPPPKPHVWKKYVRPSLDLLDDYPEHGNVNAGEVEDSKRIIVETLQSFRIDCEISDVVIGPAITRYDVIVLDKTNIKKSLQYKESIAMALKKDNVNAYLNYAKGALSIEVPNTKRTVVGLKTMLTSSGFINSKPNSLTFALGKNVEGVPICPDITKMPHLLVAGTTGSGKSICLSSLLISLLYKYGPEELRLILVDPKQVEFISYDKLPHLMINEIIYDVDKAIKALNWAIKEMERRYSLFKDMTESGVNAKGGRKVATKDLNEYNAHLEDGLEKLPKIVIVLDEFGDLMLQAKKDIESRIIKLVQKARACGIHLILATQRPSVDCITGLIKSNLPTRIGFKVGSFDDSRTIFDVGGAEKLLGKGDMYFRSAERPDLVRIQGCLVDTHEVQKVTDFIKENNETYFDQSVSDFINKVEEPEAAASLSDGGSMDSEETKIDDMFIRALKYCVDSNKASVSMLQRRFPIGYMKACKIIDWMENMNYITKGEGPNSRKVLLSRDEFVNTYGEIDD